MSVDGLGKMSEPMMIECRTWMKMETVIRILSIKPCYRQHFSDSLVSRDNPWICGYVKDLATIGAGTGLLFWEM